MRALQLVTPNQPVRNTDVALPALGPLDVRLRIRAAGICHSDAHYRSGRSFAGPLPLTLGHEAAGDIEAVGSAVENRRVGDRVCVHYLMTCGTCPACRNNGENFCPQAQMIGKHRDGGWAETLTVPARNTFVIPGSISFPAAAIMMCSSATSLHALRQANLQPGESVAVFGAGGLGLSAIQIARAMGAAEIYAVDIHDEKLALAQKLGAIPINTSGRDAAIALRDRTGGCGVNVAVELVGLPQTMSQAVDCLSTGGRAALAGITEKSFEIFPYHQLINREARVLGVSDHLASEIPLLLDFAEKKQLRLDPVLSATVPLEAGAVNDVLDRLEDFSQTGRAVICP